MTQLLETCRLAARLGGQTALDMTTRRRVRTKSRRDLVTDADEASQRAIFTCIREAYPSHILVGEESIAVEPVRLAHELEADLLWAVDPLDGTTNYVHNIPYWCVSVAALRDGQPVVAAVFDPLRDECFSGEAGAGCWLNGSKLWTSGQQRLTDALLACSFSAEVTRESDEVNRFLDLLAHARAMRRMGSTALNLAYVAAGRLDGFFTVQTHVWDMAAGGLLVREASGVVSALEREHWQPLSDSCILATASVELRHQIIQHWQSEG